MEGGEENGKRRMEKGKGERREGEKGKREREGGKERMENAKARCQGERCKEGEVKTSKRAAKENICYFLAFTKANSRGKFCKSV